MPSNHVDSPSSIDLQTIGRRRFLAFGTSAAIAGFGGCTTVMNAIGGLVLDDVNVFNETDQQKVGSIEVTDPAGELVLEERFDLLASEDEEDDESSDVDSSGAVYEDVMTDPGTYTVAIDLDEGHAIDDVASTEETVDVADVENEHVVVGLGVDDTDEPITFAVIEELSDLQEINAST